MEREHNHILCLAPITYRCGDSVPLCSMGSILHGTKRTKVVGVTLNNIFLSCFDVHFIIVNATINKVVVMLCPANKLALKIIKLLPAEKTCVFLQRL